jgi:hypothetical protein
MTSIWLDPQRFPGRAHLASVARHHAPLDRAQSLVAGDLAPAVQTRWAAHLRVDPSDLVLCATEAEACRLVLHGLLAPGDVALLAEPAPVPVLGAILSTGAAFVDVGRLHDGRIDAKALHLALTAHPQAIVIGEQPSLFGTEDRAVLQDLPARATVLSATHAQGFAGPQDLDPGALATLVALRDPDRPQVPVLHAVVCQPGTGADLMLLQGPAGFAEVTLRQALAVLEGLRDQPAWTDATEARLQAHVERFTQALQGLAGVRILPRSGWRQAAECLGGNAAEVALQLGQHLAPVHAFAPHPMRSLVVVHLGSVFAL